eukprot:SAG11_NODE_10543_length_823_cov_0.940608_1_plen_116_part_00
MLTSQRKAFQKIGGMETLATCGGAACDLPTKLTALQQKILDALHDDALQNFFKTYEIGMTVKNRGAYICMTTIVNYTQKKKKAQYYKKQKSTEAPESHSMRISVLSPSTKPDMTN